MKKEYVDRYTLKEEIAYFIKNKIPIVLLYDKYELFLDQIELIINELNKNSKTTIALEEIDGKAKELWKLLKNENIDKKQEKEIKDLLFSCYYPYVEWCVTNFLGNYNISEDFIIEASLGLVKAINTYKIGSRSNFLIFATKEIIKNIKEHFLELTKVTWNDFRLSEAIKACKDKNTMRALRETRIFLKNEQIHQERKKSDEYVPIIQENSYGPYQKVDMKIDILNALSLLPKKKRVVLISRFYYGNNQKETKELLESKYNMSQTRVHQIEKEVRNFFSNFDNRIKLVPYVSVTNLELKKRSDLPTKRYYKNKSKQYLNIYLLQDYYDKNTILEIVRNMSSYNWTMR